MADKLLLDNGVDALLLDNGTDALLLQDPAAPDTSINRLSPKAFGIREYPDPNRVRLYPRI